MQRIAAIVAIAAVSVLIAYLCSITPGVSTAIKKIDDAAYDAAYRLRKPIARDDSPVVLLEVDDQSLKTVDALADYRWPWPRGLWGLVAQKLEEKGAKAIVFDLLFSETSAYKKDDDIDFAEKLSALKIPVVIGVAGKEGRFVPPTTKPVLADTDVLTSAVGREYRLITQRSDSLALAAVRSIGLEIKHDFPPIYRPHYYGPHRFISPRMNDNLESPIPAYSAGSIAIEAIDDSVKNAWSRDIFKDKIVVIGATAAALHDLKSSPWSDKYPGVEIQATAMLNLLRGDQVHLVPSWLLTMIGLAGSLIIAIGVILFRQSEIKLIAITAAIILLIFMTIYLMQQPAMHWLAIAQPMLAMILTSIGALVWTYRIEDAHSRFLLKALSQCISPDVAKELAANPSRLAVGGKKQMMTVLFSDLEGFTKLAETIGERVEPVLNLYLGEMSQQILDRNGTIDKFIGDAIMAFWNAPIAQPDHARLACESALAIIRRENELAPRLAELGAGTHRMFTRIGINTGEPVVGFYGSTQRLSYTAVGDTVNLAARLEPINKLYKTQIVVSRETAHACGDSMLFRPIDRVKVVGRTEPVGLYELLCARNDATVDQLWLAEQSALAAEAYLSRNWQHCRALVDKILGRYPNDGPALVWKVRVESYIASPPAEDWDGVFEAKSK